MVKLLGTLTLALLMVSHVSADLWNGGGFEGNLGWTGTDSFMGQTATNGANPNDARFFDFIDGNMITEAGTWVEDASRAFEGNRMFWLRDYNDPDTICAGYRFQNVLAPGENYRLDWSFAAFNPNQPTGSSALTSKPIVEVMSWDTNLGDWVLSEPIMNFSDGQSADPENGNLVEYTLQDWDNLQWTRSTSLIEAPQDNGRPIYIWVSMSNDSNGLLVDGITLTAVPEPGSVGLLLLGIPIAALRRRKPAANRRR